MHTLVEQSVINGPDSVHRGANTVKIIGRLHAARNFSRLSPNRIETFFAH
jgi:hypothetical protein